jgi:hypothetical protein
MKDIQSNNHDFKEKKMIQHINQNYINGNLYIYYFFTLLNRKLSGKKHIYYDPNLISNKKVFYWEKATDKKLNQESDINLENERNIKDIKVFETFNHGNII